MPVAVCTVIELLMMDGKTPETCRVLFKNTCKECEKLVHLVGFTIEIQNICLGNVGESARTHARKTTFPIHPFKIHYNLIHPSTPSFSKQSLSFQFNDVT
jgi:hypothetical protein